MRRHSTFTRAVAILCTYLAVDLGVANANAAPVAGDDPVAVEAPMFVPTAEDLAAAPMKCERVKERDSFDKVFNPEVAAAAGACLNNAGNLAPYCTDGCGASRPCSKTCRNADGSCSTCGDYGYCEGMTGGGGGGTNDGDSSVTVNPANVAVYGRGESTDPNATVKVKFEYYDGQTGALIGTKSQTGKGAPVILNDSLSLGAGGQVTAYGWGVIGIIITVVILVGGAVVVSKTYKSDMAATCFSNPQMVDGQCRYDRNCVGTLDCQASSQLFHTMAPVGGSCPANLRKTYRYSGFKVGSVWFFTSCAQNQYTTPASCACS
jgi:hypothetical protein